MGINRCIQISVLGRTIVPEQLLKWVTQVQERVACYKARRKVYSDIMKKSPKPGMPVLTEWEEIL